MILRPYQKDAIKAGIKALDKKGNTLVVAPTGAGKTIMMAEMIDQLNVSTFDRFSQRPKTIVLQHRLKLVEQNVDKFRRVCGDRYTTGVLTGTVRQPDADVVFTTVQTLEKNLDLVGMIDHVIIDEAHHVAADTYYKCVEHLHELNPDMKTLGFTATADRSDGKGLGDVFSNVAYQVEIDLLIELGFLVQPKSFIIDIGVNDEVAEVTALSEYGTLSDVQRQERLSEVYAPHLPKIVEKWKEHAPDRHTVVFCTTIAQAEELQSAFTSKGYTAGCVHSNMKQAHIDDVLERFDEGKFHILVNVAILTEGYDCPPVDCIMLVRGCSSQATMTQMLGRGLRIIEPGDYPWSSKEDCIILDFGDSIRIHGTLRSDANLREIRNQRTTDDPFALTCPHCERIIIVDAETTVCPECGGSIMEAVEEEVDAMVVGRVEKITLEDWKMTEAKLTGYSPFAWVDLTANELQGLDHDVFVANGFEAHAVILRNEDKCFAIGKLPDSGYRLIGKGREKVVFAQANNFMSNHETSSQAKKSATWMRRPMSSKQLTMLDRYGWKRNGEMPGRYTASCLLTYIFNHRKIKELYEEMK